MRELNKALYFAMLGRIIFLFCIVSNKSRKIYRSQVECKTIITPLLTHWSYNSLARRHRIFTSLGMILGMRTWNIGHDTWHEDLELRA